MSEGACVRVLCVCVCVYIGMQLMHSLYMYIHISLRETSHVTRSYTISLKWLCLLLWAQCVARLPTGLTPNFSVVVHV